MANLLSPGVNVNEIDLTTVVPSVSTSVGAIAGLFRWGPVGELVSIDSASALSTKFGTPTNYNPETYFTAENFLAYSSNLIVSRAANTTGATPVISANVTSGSPIAYVANTANVVAGMYISQVSDSTVLNFGQNVVITSIINSSAVTLSSNALATNGAVSIYLANPSTSYSALGFDPSSSGVTANLVNQIIKNSNDFYTKSSNTFDTGVLYIAKYPGELGNSLRVAECDTAASFTSNISYSGTTLNFNIGSNTAVATFNGTGNTSANVNQYTIGDKILAGNSTIGYQYLQLTNIVASNSGSNTNLVLQFQDPYRLYSAYSTNTVSRFWEFYSVVDGAPSISPYVLSNGNTAAIDEVHIVVVDDNGGFTGVPGTVLEVFKGLSRATDATNLDGTVNYYRTVINLSSQYVWNVNDRAGAPSANAANITSATVADPANISLNIGSDGYDETNVNNFPIVAAAYDMFQSAEDVDISLVMQGYPLGGDGASYQLANYIIDNIVTLRGDCIALISPDKTNILNAFGNEAFNLVNWRNSLHSTSYAVLDSGYKYQFDRYNNVYRWIPLNGDIAGLCARTDSTNDAWWSPAGFNRGQIKNLVRLAYNPKQTDRDTLYKNGINPVVTFPGQGTILYGDKTLQAKPSAFDRINVRRLFIVLEKAISIAAKYSLFEFNDTFTRSQFMNLVTPYLRTIQGRRGITDYLVVCDDTNNTAAIIDSNQFVGDILIKPARSINFIQLNFVAVGTGVQFSEVVGQY
jgi:phage tail sheath protein FI